MSRRGCIGFFAHKIFIPPYLRFLPLYTKFSHQMKYVRCCTLSVQREKNVEKRKKSS